MNPELKKLYDLLPALYRTQDADQGETLKQLLSIVAEQMAVLREDMDQLYDDQFIETCAEWAIPYIGDLIGYRALHNIPADILSPRAEAANTIAYRRRKGTASVLEQLARDVTHWDARVVEFFQRLATTQYMNHIRLNNLATPDLRKWEPLERLDTAFDSLSHTVDVRRISTAGGKYNIPNIGIFLWRLDAWRIHKSPAFPVDRVADNKRFMFSPLGNNMQLVARPEKEATIAHLAEPINVPEPISRRVLDENHGLYYGEELSLFIEAGGVDTSIGNVEICNLSDDGGGWAHVPENKIAIDPVLGRIAFPDAPPNDSVVRVTYHYGFSAPMGGGEYRRSDTFAVNEAPTHSVSQGESLQPRLDDLTGGGLVEIADSGRYEEILGLGLKVDSGLAELRSAQEARPTIVLNGNLKILLGDGAAAELNGLLIGGGPVVVANNPGIAIRELRLKHCALVPGLELDQEGRPVSPEKPSLIILQEGLTLVLDRCITGPIHCPPGAKIKISNSIIDANGSDRVAFSGLDGESEGGELTLENTTVIGKVHAEKMPLVSNSIFHARLAESDDWPAPVISKQTQTGCVRFSFVPEGSVVPKRFRCQPESAVSQALRAARKENPALSDAQKTNLAAEIISRVQPSFTSLQYGEAAYGQLSRCPEEIRSGADDESEMGAFHDLFSPQRESNLKTRLDEYLKVGLEAGVFYAN